MTRDNPGAAPGQFDDLEKRFFVREELGRGGMGVVYRAHDKLRRADVALKVLRRVDGPMLFHFKNEFRGLANIVHDNLVTLYELKSQEDRWFFTMELIEGVSFLDFVRPNEGTSTERASHASPAAAAEGDTISLLTALGARGSATPVSSTDGRRATFRHDGELDIERLRHCLGQLVEGVAALHAAGKLHRDLKPSNVLVEDGGRVVICDFGLVVERGFREHDGSVSGTPVYMSPEQAAGEPLDEASDWFSLGVMLYAALAGRLPFDGPSRSTRGHVGEIPDLPRPAESLPDLNDLCMELLHRDPKKRPDEEQIFRMLGCGHDAAAVSGDTPHGAAPFVGRETQLSELRQALAASREGHSVAVLVSGRSGMGKSALIRHFLDELREQDSAVVLEGRCYQRETVPYKALDSLVDALSEHLLNLPPDVAARFVPRDALSLARLFPVLSRVPAIARPVRARQVPRDPQELRKRAFGALRDLLGKFADEHPLVFFIDDLQWGDVDSAPFLIDLIHHPDSPALTLVGSYRIDEATTSPLLRTLLVRDSAAGGSGDVRRLALEPLDDDEARELVLRLVDNRRTPAFVQTESIVRDAGGSPFFLAELTRAAIDNRALAADRMSLEDVLHQRIELLPSGARALLGAAAVAGRPIPVTLLSKAGEVKDEPAAVARLEAERLVRTRHSGDLDEVEPYHDRIRETVTSRMSESELRGFHGRLARALEASRHDDAPALVEHWLGAGDRQRAGRYAVKAADQSARSMAFHRAAEYYGTALEHLELDDNERRQLMSLRGDALAGSGALAEAAKTHLAAAALAKPVEALDLRRRAMQQLLRSGDLEQGMSLARSVLSDVGLALPRTHLGTLASIVFHRARLAIRGLQFETRPPEEIDPERLRRLEAGWSVSSGLGIINPMIGMAAQSRYMLEALSVGDPYQAVRAFSMQVGFLSTAGGRKRAQIDRVRATMHEIAEKTGDPFCIGLSFALHGLSCYLRGDWKDCNEYMTRGEKILLDNSANARWQVDSMQIYRMASLFYLGRLRELTESLPILLREAHDRGDAFLGTGLKAWRSNVSWLVQDDPDEARRQAGSIDAAWAGSKRLHLHHYFALLSNGQHALYVGDGRGAYARIDAKWRDVRRSMLLRVQSVRIEGQFLRGRCALAAAACGGGDRKSLLHAARGAADTIAAEREAWGDPLAELLRAGAAFVEGDVDRALQRLDHAQTGFDHADMALYAAATKRRRGELSGGDEGSGLVAEAVQWMQGEAVRDPDRMTRMLAPGFD